MLWGTNPNLTLDLQRNVAADSLLLEKKVWPVGMCVVNEKDFEMQLKAQKASKLN